MRARTPTNEPGWRYSYPWVILVAAWWPALIGVDEAVCAAVHLAFFRLGGVPPEGSAGVAQLVEH